MRISEHIREAKRSLYHRLGGHLAIADVVVDFRDRLAADSTVGPYFARSDMSYVTKMLIEQVVHLTGGPSAYTGRDMVSAHKGLNITTDAWRRTVNHLKAALKSAGATPAATKELIGILGALKDEIVGQ